MAGELVFITGATGFIGFAVLLDSLKAGYRVRASVRQASQITTLRAHPLIQPFLHNLDFVVVPDITTVGAFDDVLKDVIFIEHVASPLPNPALDPETGIIQPAIKGTTTLLHSALKIPSIRRVVITSSLVAIIPGQALVQGDSKTIYTSTSRVTPLPTAPWNPSYAYAASKVLALDAVDHFLAEQKPHFSIVNLHPGFVVGEDELVTDKAENLVKGSNKVVLDPLLGNSYDSSRPTEVVHVRDVARIHVLALDEKKVEGNRGYLLDGGEVKYENMFEIVKKNFPEEVNEGLLPLGGKVPSVSHKLDMKESIELFGKFKPFGESVKSLVAQYLKLKKAEQ